MQSKDVFSRYTCMLRMDGFSLFEMLISITLSTLIVMGALSCYPQLQINIMHYYQQFRLQQITQNALIGLSKDIKRAGFIANDPQKMKQKALEILEQKSCIIIRYDSEIRHDWIYDPINIKNSDIFIYRYDKNNIEYKTGSLDCKGSNWEKLFDPAEIKVTSFTIKPRANAVEISVTSELKKNNQIKYQTTKIIKNENIF